MKKSSHKEIQPPRMPKRLPEGSLPVLKDDGDYSAIALSGCNLAGPKADRLLFETVLFRRGMLGPSRHSRPRFVDCRLEASDLSGIDWEKARFRRVEFLGCRGIGAQLVDSEFKDVTFKECNLERAVFVSAKFRAARFASCSLREVSFENADLAGVVFEDCDLTRVDLRLSKLLGADLRGSKMDGAQVGMQELKGAIIDSLQVVQIAGLLGVIVKEKGE